MIIAALLPLRRGCYRKRRIFTTAAYSLPPGENIRAIAPHFSFIDQTRESTGAGQHAKEGNFGKRNSGVTVIN